jgi:hypothetical protein
VAQHIDRDLGLLQGLGHHEPDIFVRLGTNPFSAQTSRQSGTVSGRQPLFTDDPARTQQIAATDMRARGGHTTLCVFSRLGNMIAKILRRDIVAKTETKYRACAKCDRLVRTNLF